VDVIFFDDCQLQENAAVIILCNIKDLTRKKKTKTKIIIKDFAFRRELFNNDA